MTPMKVASLASNASTALSLVEHGLRGAATTDALNDGIEVCLELECGLQAARAPTFSARSLGAGNLVRSILALPCGERTLQRVGEVVKLLVAVKGGDDAAVGKIGDYFHDLAVEIPRVLGRPMGCR